MSDNTPQAPQGEFVLFQAADGKARWSAVLSRICCG